MRIIPSKSFVDQVEEILRGRIREGSYAAGSRIPSETELSEEFGVSRATVRTVLARLAAYGLILRKQGDGTYVNPRINTAGANFGSLWDFVTLIENNGFKPGIQALAMEVRQATEKEAAALAIEPHEKLLAMTRLFTADDRPVILSNNVFPATLFSVPPERVEGSLPIREIIRRFCRQEIAFAITDIRSCLTGDALGSTMGIPSGTAILELQLSFYSKENIPLSLGVNYYNDAVLRLCLTQSWN